MQFGTVGDDIFDMFADEEPTRNIVDRLAEHLPEVFDDVSGLCVEQNYGLNKTIDVSASSQYFHSREFSYGDEEVFMTVHMRIKYSFIGSGTLFPNITVKLYSELPGRVSGSDELSVDEDYRDLDDAYDRIWELAG